MKESAKYLNFFHRNWLVLIVCLALCSGVGGWVDYNQPVIYSSSRLYVLDETKVSGNEGIAKLDQAVALTRAEQMRGELGLMEGSRLTVYKNSPLSIYAEVVGASFEQSKSELMKVDGYLVLNYPVRLVGEGVNNQTGPVVWRGVLIGLAAGWLGGLLISLGREYFKHF